MYFFVVLAHGICNYMYLHVQARKPSQGSASRKVMQQTYLFHDTIRCRRNLKFTESQRSLTRKYVLLHIIQLHGTAVAQWLRCCATNQKVAGSIPADVSGIFH